jgi:hypothetical protein
MSLNKQQECATEDKTASGPTRGPFQQVPRLERHIQGRHRCRPLATSDTCLSDTCDRHVSVSSPFSDAVVCAARVFSLSADSVEKKTKKKDVERVTKSATLAVRNGEKSENTPL